MESEDYIKNGEWVKERETQEVRDELRLKDYICGCKIC